MRDVPSVVACLIEEPPEANIMKIFLLKILQLQRRRRKKDNFNLGEGLMLVSFKVEIDEKCKSVKELRVADYDCNATGRVAPIDSLFWWPILLQSYEKGTRDYSLVDTPEVQKGMKCICDLCLSDGFDTVPSLLCADPCCMIDKEMGALACLMKETPETYIVEKLSLKTLQLQGCRKKRDNFTLGEGVMPASFKVEVEEKYGSVKEMWVADYGGTTTGRVAPTNSWFWWIILLQSYDNCTSDNSLADTPEMQKSMKWIADLCLSDGFDTFPSLLFADAYCMTDRRKVFVMDFDVVNKILLKTLQFLARGKKINNFILREGVMPLMPTRFMLEIDEKCEHGKEMLVAEYGGTTTGRVALMDFGFWWIIFLQSYDKHTRDYSLADIPEMHKGMKWMVFTRDIVIVKIFLLKTLHIQGCENIGNFTLREGVMPASFKVEIDKECQCVKEILVAVCGGTATGTVAPTGFGFSVIILLQSYEKRTRDHPLEDMPEVQKGMKLILDIYQLLLSADASCIIGRRMVIYGYPIEIQTLLCFAYRCAKHMLKDVLENKELLDKIKPLSYHIGTYYCLDYTQLSNIYLYETEEYSHTALNKFNITPESILDWLFKFLSLRGGYFISNASPACMDFRWFFLGNCIAILSSRVIPIQASASMGCKEFDRKRSSTITIEDATASWEIHERLFLEIEGSTCNMHTESNDVIGNHQQHVAGHIIVEEARSNAEALKYHPEVPFRHGRHLLDHSSSESSSVSKGVWEGLAISSLSLLGIILLIILLVLFFYYRRKKKGIVDVGVDVGVGTHLYEELAEATNQFDENRVIGRGGFGVVYKGELAEMEVAVKRKREDSTQGLNEFQAEIQLMPYLNHANIAEIVGHCTTQTEKLIVYRYFPNKTVYHHLHDNIESTLNWKRRWGIANGVAEGVAYLHSREGKPTIIHRDLKSENILLTIDYDPVITDFGLARHKIGVFNHIFTEVKGTIGYLDADYMLTSILRVEADVFSFGIILLELVSGRKPVDEENPFPGGLTFLTWANNLIRVAFESQASPSLFIDCRLEQFDKQQTDVIITCALCCTRQNVEDRPTMSQVVQVLKGELAVDVIVGPDGLWPPAQIPSNLTLADSDSSTEEVS